MERKLRRCAVCGTEYKFCPRCNEDKDKPLYHYTFCSKNCRDIYSVISDYEDKEITAKEAFEILSELDLSKKDCFNTSYKNSLDNIHQNIPKKQKRKNKTSELVEEVITDKMSEENGIYEESKGFEETYVE